MIVKVMFNSDNNSVDIIIGDQEIFLTYLQGKDIEQWFSPSSNDEWEGFIPEIYNLIDNESEKVVFEFNGDNKAKLTFDKFIKDKTIVGASIRNEQEFNIDLEEKFNEYQQYPFEEIIEKYTILAEYGYKPAQVKLYNFYKDAEYEDDDSYAKGLQLAFKWCEVLSRDNIDMKVTLAEYYLYGYGVEENDLLAVDIFKKYAEIGHVNAQYFLGICHLYEYGGLKDNCLGIELVEKAALGNHEEAMILIADIYVKGEGIAQDYKKALYWFDAILLNFPNSTAYRYDELLLSIADCHFYDMDLNYKDAFKWYEKAAHLGNSKAESMLGKCFYHGYGVDKDYRQAIYWFEKSAEKENSFALYMLGEFYYSQHNIPSSVGIATVSHTNDTEFLTNSSTSCSISGTDGSTQKLPLQNYKTAFEYYQKSVKNQFDVPIDAYYSLGECYLLGLGTEKDVEKAFVLFEKAAEHDHDAALYRAGECYYLGIGVQQDYPKAVELFLKAAKQDQPNAQDKLGDCYFSGYGVDINYEEAFIWYEIASNNSNPEAMFMLANCYYFGVGQEKDYTLAFYWFEKSAEFDNKLSIEFLTWLCYYGIGTEKNIDKAIFYSNKIDNLLNIDSSKEKFFEIAEEIARKHKLKKSSIIKDISRTGGLLGIGALIPIANIITLPLAVATSVGASVIDWRLKINKMNSDEKEILLMMICYKLLANDGHEEASKQLKYLESLK